MKVLGCFGRSRIEQTLDNLDADAPVMGSSMRDASSDIAQLRRIDTNRQHIGYIRTSLRDHLLA
jgi:hypothetical protein